MPHQDSLHAALIHKQTASSCGLCLTSKGLSIQKHWVIIFAALFSGVAIVLAQPGHWCVCVSVSAGQGVPSASWWCWTLPVPSVRYPGSIVCTWPKLHSVSPKHTHSLNVTFLVKPNIACFWNAITIFWICSHLNCFLMMCFHSTRLFVLP